MAYGPLPALASTTFVLKTTPSMRPALSRRLSAAKIIRTMRSYANMDAPVHTASDMSFFFITNGVMDIGHRWIIIQLGGSVENVVERGKLQPRRVEVWRHHE